MEESTNKGWQPMEVSTDGDAVMISLEGQADALRIEPDALAAVVIGAGDVAINYRRLHHHAVPADRKLSESPRRQPAPAVRRRSRE